LSLLLILSGNQVTEEYCEVLQAVYLVMSLYGQQPTLAALLKQGAKKSGRTQILLSRGLHAKCMRSGECEKATHKTHLLSYILSQLLLLLLDSGVLTVPAGAVHCNTKMAS